MDTRSFVPKVDTLARDGSEIPLLVSTARGSMAHCTLPAGTATRAVRHRTVGEQEAERVADHWPSG